MTPQTSFSLSCRKPFSPASNLITTPNPVLLLPSPSNPTSSDSSTNSVTSSKTHHHNQWQDTLETRISEEEIVPSDIAHLVLDCIHDPELGLKFFDWVTQRPYGCSLDGFAYSSVLKLLASSRVFLEIETVLESMKVEDKLPTPEALDLSN
ncbi:Pentatricopeptide repeat-containing protein [Camellia lanceoleosa]|uniref:Pentatricopeptide repeat-containing protein n=1 Tax=Camellia lanceoleosa TaxID=1840588 RepID=A0ACC0IDQ5_9ERIC|nr:Pentatricopeptide repeat-containing protein [Camellia lanceoleosa]